MGDFSWGLRANPSLHSPSLEDLWEMCANKRCAACYAHSSLVKGSQGWDHENEGTVLY